MGNGNERKGYMCASAQEKVRVSMCCSNEAKRWCVVCPNGEYETSQHCVKDREREMEGEGGREAR